MRSLRASRNSAVLTLATLAALSPAPATAQKEAIDLLAWMGLQTGDTMVFETEDGGRMCVTVGSPRRIGGRAVAPLEGLAWPGLASDSRILVPLDGTLEFLVDRTPGPRPTMEALLPADGGWSVDRSDWNAAETLVYRWCEACMDAGLRIVLERGGGIRSIWNQSIAGPTTLTRLEGGCAEREETEFEICVEPAP
ncbi:MAG TPA: hypothetical protein VIG29_01260 [Vicinamibacteria bacterium]|jgi:hypothetical protein